MRRDVAVDAGDLTPRGGDVVERKPLIQSRAMIGIAQDGRHGRLEDRGFFRALNEFLAPRLADQFVRRGPRLPAAEMRFAETDHSHRGRAVCDRRTTR